MALADAGRSGRSSMSWFYNPTFRSFAIQAVLLVVIVVGAGLIIHNATQNLANLHIASGWAFLSGRAGFGVQTFLPFSADDTYGYGLWVGFVDTVIVSVLGIIMATVLGIIVGVARLSSNWLIRTLASVYVEIFRNIPPLLVIFFWYFAVLAVLPNPRDAIGLGLDISLSNRGLTMPRPVFGSLFLVTAVAFVVGLIAAYLLKRWADTRQAATGQPFPRFWAGLGIVVVLTGLAFLVTGAPLSFDLPVKTRFNLNGGMTLWPEFVSLLVALGVYTASFIAEIVRAGIMAVSHGQTEAASALGLRGGTTLRLVVLPQAFRVIIPPLTSEYLNLIKNSSLAVAIGYADLVAIGGSVLNQTGQSIEVVTVWMAVYLGISLITSFGMNEFNRRMALVER
jgi:general L-amino acid transport system permease protein